MPQPPRTGLPLELHGALGSVLAHMRNTLVHAEVFLGNTYTKRDATRVTRVRVALDRLRCRLDSAVFREYPTLAHAARVYYPVAVQLAPVVPVSLAEVCRVLDAYGATMQDVAKLLLTHYPVAVGDAALVMAQALTYQAQELPHAVGPPKHRRHVA